MNNFGITEKTYLLLLSSFSKYEAIEHVVLFGSRAKGNYKPGSDIDFAIKGKNCSSKLVLNLSAYLNEKLPIPYFIDLVNYNSLNHPGLKEHIDRVGIIFYGKSLVF